MKKILSTGTLLLLLSLLAAPSNAQIVVNQPGTLLPSTCTNGQVVTYNTSTNAWDTCATNGAGGGAPADATYITQTANGSLSNEQALASLATGILKSTTTTGVLSIAVAGDFPTLNQNTTGSAAKWTTARNLAGNSVDGSANVAFSNAFIVQGTADSGLTGAQFLGALSTGIMKVTTTTGAVTSLAIPLTLANGGTDVSSAADDTTLISSGSAWVATAINDCTGTGKALTYLVASNAFGCNTISAAPGGSDTQIQYNNSSAFGGSSSFIVNTSATDPSITIGSASVTSGSLLLKNSNGDTSKTAGIQLYSSTVYFSNAKGGAYWFKDSGDAAWLNLTNTHIVDLTLGIIKWSNPGDAYLFAPAAATFQLGQDVNGAAVSQQLQAANGITGTDKTGGNLTLASGKGTGAGAVSQVLIQTPTVLGSGTTAQSLTTRVTIDSNGLKATGYLSSDGTAGVTVTTCTGFKNGLCISGT